MARIAWLCGLGLTVTVAASPLRADPPTTRPAEPAAGSTEVLVTAFRPLSDAPTWAWAGRAVQQSLSGDLARADFRPTIGDGNDPVAAARAAGARYVVVGTYQWVEPRLRFDGQLIDVSTGAPAASIGVTGDGSDLFALEDDLSGQLVRAMHRVAGRPRSTSASKSPRPIPPDLQPDALAAVIAPPAVGNSSAYAGSKLEAYLNANRTPAVDFQQQLADVRQRNTYGTYNNYGGPYGNGIGAFGGGFGFGGFGYSGFGFGGGYTLGISYPIAAGGPFGYAPYGGAGRFSASYGVARGSFAPRGGYR